MNEAEPLGINIGEFTVASAGNSSEAPKTPRRRNPLITQERHRFQATLEPALAIENLESMLDNLVVRAAAAIRFIQRETAGHRYKHAFHSDQAALLRWSYRCLISR